MGRGMRREKSNERTRDGIGYNSHLLFPDGKFWKRHSVREEEN